MNGKQEGRGRLARARNVGRGVGGFSMSLLAPALCVAFVVFFLDAIWTARQDLLTVFFVTLASALLALVASWACIFRALRHEAAVRGARLQIFTVVTIAGAALAWILYA